MRRVVVLALVVALGLLSGSVGSAAAATTDLRAVVGVVDLHWEDISPQRTPTLWRLARTTGVGALSITATRRPTMRQDAWATLSAGDRVRVPPGSYPAPDREGTGAAQEGVQHVNAVPEHLPSDRLVGRLGDALHQAGRCTAVTGPLRPMGSVVGAGDSAGRVDVVGSARSAAAHGCAVLVLEADISGGARGQALRELDARVDRLLQVTPHVLVLGLADTTEEHLHPIIDTDSVGLLTSGSTRRAGFVQLIDVAPTLLDRLGVAVPPEVVGRVISADGRAGRWWQHRAEVLRHDAAARAADRAQLPLFVVWVAGLVACALLWWRGRPVMTGALVVSCLPAASYLAALVPWWRGGTALLAVVTLAGAALLGALVRWHWRLGPADAVAAATLGVLLADLATGGWLQVSTPLGYSPLVAGRFTGVGNLAFGVLAASALWLAGALLPQRRLVAGVLVGAVLLDGAPVLGADVGGTLALVPAAALLLLGGRVSWRKALAAGSLGLLAVGAFAALDLSRPARRRTHLGRFVDDLVHGRASTVLRRKALADLDLVTHSPLTLLFTAIAAGLLVTVLLRGGETGAWPGLRATAVCGLIGFAVNDSGLGVLAGMALVSVPLVLLTPRAAWPSRHAPTSLAEPGGVLP